ncbi:hypothetical protein [Flavobacterium sp.]|uniref:hypothetical protein n=1 Tax=Flavobacterium sp. TaxID=239 RepID=UPI0011FF8816|nr:hypothetical protein [Flavobacterium sp.]RZJ72407.1 MAG: hypothetical protein EOO49_05710 [Flavobacterium sp.]
MKNSIKSILSLFVAVGFTACSSDDSTIPNSANLVLVKKVTETIHAGDFSETSVVEFNYTGNRLTSVQQGATSTTFAYSGDKPISALRTYGSGEQVSSTFTYNGDNLVSIVNNSDYSETTDFTYVNNMLATMSDRYLGSGQWIQGDSRQLTFGSGNNLVSEIVDRGTSVYRNDYTFDNQNMPFRNLAVPFRLIYRFEGIDLLNNNNPLSITRFSPPTATQPTASSYFEMQYNDQGYPTQIVKYSADGNPISTTLIDYL